MIDFYVGHKEKRNELKAGVKITGWKWLTYLTKRIGYLFTLGSVPGDQDSVTRNILVFRAALGPRSGQRHHGHLTHRCLSQEASNVWL